MTEPDPSTKDGAGLGNVCAADLMEGSASAASQDIVVRSDNSDRERHGCTATARAPTSTNNTRGTSPRRNRTEDTVAAEPPTKHRKTSRTSACCNCSRHSTCSSHGRQGRPGCPCLLARRKCFDCLCFRQCRNKHNLLPALTSAQTTESLVLAFFPRACSTDPTTYGPLTTQPETPADEPLTQDDPVPPGTDGIIAPQTTITEGPPRTTQEPDDQVPEPWETEQPTAAPPLPPPHKTRIQSHQLAQHRLGTNRQLHCLR